MPPTTLPPPGALSVEQRLANLESICNVDSIASVPCALFNADGQIFPPLLNWTGNLSVGLNKPSAGAYGLPPVGDYMGAAFTVTAVTGFAHTVNGLLIVDGVARSVATFNGAIGSSFTLVATVGKGWVVTQATGVTFS